METNELIDLLTRRLDSAQRAIDVLADDAAENGRPCRAREAAELAELCRTAVAAARDVTPEQSAAGCPGYPGPCPDGMDWGEWLAINNVD